MILQALVYRSLYVYLHMMATFVNCLADWQLK